MIKGCTIKYRNFHRCVHRGRSGVFCRSGVRWTLGRPPGGTIVLTPPKPRYGAMSGTPKKKRKTGTVSLLDHTGTGDRDRGGDRVLGLKWETPTRRSCDGRGGRFCTSISRKTGSAFLCDTYTLLINKKTYCLVYIT